MWNSIDEIRTAHQGHWFDASTLAFFNSVVHDEIVSGRYFVTSERAPYDDAPRWTVREADADAEILTVGEFYSYATREEALAAARAL